MSYINEINGKPINEEPIYFINKTSGNPTGIDVPMGSSNIINFSSGIKTQNLRNCISVIITDGNQPTSKIGLIHLPGSEATSQALEKAYKEIYPKMKDKNKIETYVIGGNKDVPMDIDEIKNDKWKTLNIVGACSPLKGITKKYLNVQVGGIDQAIKQKVFVEFWIEND